MKTKNENRIVLPDGVVILLPGDYQNPRNNSLIVINEVGGNKDEVPKASSIVKTTISWNPWPVDGVHVSAVMTGEVRKFSDHVFSISRNDHGDIEGRLNASMSCILAVPPKDW